MKDNCIYEIIWSKDPYPCTRYMGLHNGKPSYYSLFGRSKENNEFIATFQQAVFDNTVVVLLLVSIPH